MATNVLFRSSIALLVLVSLVTGGRTQAPQVNLGVVDVNKVLANYPKAIEAKKNLDATAKQIEDKLDEEAAFIKDLRIRQEAYKRGTIEWLRMELDITQALNLRDGHNRVWQAEYNEKVNKFLIQAYDEIEAAIVPVAKAKKVQLVVRRDASVDFKANQYERRVVWYASDEIDLTAAVIEQLRVPLPAAPPGEKAADKGGNGASPATVTPGKSGNDKE